ncbi:MAG: Gfo/Idh/MocA family protein [Candidatus Binataceae bacterium]
MKIRGAISGFGEVAAQAHLPGWRTRANVTIGAVHEPIAERRHEAIRLIEPVRVYDDLALMLDGEHPDFVDVASPPAMHFAAARAVLEAGAHVLVEKPLCLTLREFDELAALAASRGRVLMCVHNWKFAPAYVAARAAIDAGRIGAPRSVSLERFRTQPAGAGGSGGRWRSAAASGGGILIDHGWHAFYLMRWLLGGAEPELVSARLESSAADGVDHVAEVRIGFSGSSRGSAHLSWRAPNRRTSATIEGADGVIEIDGSRLTISSRGGASEELPVADIPDDSYHSAWFGGVTEQFEDAIRAGRDSPAARINLAEARAALGLILSARESSSSGGIEVKFP